MNWNEATEYKASVLKDSSRRIAMDCIEMVSGARGKEDMSSGYKALAKKWPDYREEFLRAAGEMGK